jgi:phosphocarrier protein HPr
MPQNRDMQVFTVNLKSISEVKEFVRIVNDYVYNVDLISGRYIVDAKSIMGIFSLDLARPIVLEIHSDTAEDLVQRLEPFINNPGN